MIIPPTGIDALGQRAEAQITFLRYRLVLGYEEDSVMSTVGRLVIRAEELVHINKGYAVKRLGFPNRPAWRNSVVDGRRTSPFISTSEEAEGTIIQRHQEGNQGRAWKYKAGTLPRTVLSNTTAGESATTVLAKQEMQSWRLLQLEPSALRQPDEFSAISQIASNGLHLPAALYRLARQGTDEEEAAQYARVSSRLAELNEDVRRVRIDRDDKRELLTLEVEDRSGTRHKARALSDGTLRFLALTVIEEDQQLGGVLCLEEPENGIHPARLEAMLTLLQDIATNPNLPVGTDNPLRQVIINTHSPGVVQLVPDDSLVFVERVLTKAGTSQVQFSALADTWRTMEDRSLREIQKGKMLAYLGAAVLGVPEARDGDDDESAADKRALRVRRVIDRPDIRQLRLDFVDLDAR